MMEDVVHGGRAGRRIGGDGLGAGCREGENSFKKCLPCHSIGADAQEQDRACAQRDRWPQSGHHADYNYSDANKNSGITWNEANFKEYIKDPKAKIPGTKMVFAGIKNDDEINNLWAYISQFDKDGGVKKK